MLTPLTSLHTGRSGQLGHGDTNKRLIPRVVKPLLHTFGRTAASGAEFMMAITSWKPPAPAPPPSPSPLPHFEVMSTAPHRPISRSISSVAFSGRDVVRPLFHNTPDIVTLGNKLLIAQQRTEQ